MFLLLANPHRGGGCLMVLVVFVFFNCLNLLSSFPVVLCLCLSLVGFVVAFASSFAAASWECTCYLRWIPAPSCSTIASYVVAITDSSLRLL